MLVVRPATANDSQAIAALYRVAVETGTATWELDAPDAAEIARRLAAITADGHPWLVAADGDGTLLGYAYAGPYRPRAAYRFTVENSVYVAEEAQGRGVGRLLLSTLITACTARGYRQMIAVIGDSGNAASIGLHRALGFTDVGIARAVGFKHGRWLDQVLMQKSLGDGDATPPA